MPKTHGSCIHAGVCKYEDEQRASDCDDYVNNDVEEKAGKWDRFVGIQSCNDCPACPECPCDDTNCPALKIENALTKEADHEQ